jgi:hypothetical protein
VILAGLLLAVEITISARAVSTRPIPRTTVVPGATWATPERSGPWCISNANGSSHHAAGGDFLPRYCRPPRGRAVASWVQLDRSLVRPSSRPLRQFGFTMMRSIQSCT